MRTSITLTLAGAAMAMVAMPGTGSAKDMQHKHTGAAHHAGAMSTQDFVKHAAQGGMAEVSLGKLAADKATDPDVKQFAQRMVDDHSKANEELTNLATAKGMQPPPSPDAQQQALMDRLGKLSGPAFDRAYMQAMVGDHNHDVSEFRTFAQRGTDPDVKAWAAKTLPTLEEHQQLAKTTAAKIGAGNKSARTGKSSTIKGTSAAQRSKNATTAQGSTREH
jgi:putative membrane protein